jgi:hypothetical protein
MNHHVWGSRLEISPEHYGRGSPGENSDVCDCAEALRGEQLFSVVRRKRPSRIVRSGMTGLRLDSILEIAFGLNSSRVQQPNPL